MNLHSIIAPVIGAVNPNQQVGLQVSVGQSVKDDGSVVPQYATPGAVTASIGGTFTGSIPDPTQPTHLAVATLAGSLWPGDVVSGTDGVNALPAGTTILGQLSGQPGGAGTYELDRPAVLNSCEVTAESAVLNVTATVAGVLQAGQQLFDQGALLPETAITGRLNGAGQVGTYSINRQQRVPLETMTTEVVATAQMQPLTFRDLQHLEGLNLSGEIKAIYVNGPLNGVVRPRLKGGDIVTHADGTVWLVVQILEAWNVSAGWTKAAIRLQNDVIVAAPTTAPEQSDAQPAGAP
jgi:hypothetical protein